MSKPVAILSTTILPLDGTYKVTTLDTVPDITGVPHYIGHPTTAAIVADLGAVKADSNLFAGLQPGQTALAFAIAQGKSTRATQGHTTPHQDVTMADLTVRQITRIN